MIEILGEESMMTVQIKNKEQLNEGGFIVRNAKPFCEEESYILRREPLNFEKDIHSKKKIRNGIGVLHCILSLAIIGSKQTK